MDLFCPRGGRGKVMWLDPEDPSVPNGSVLRRRFADIYASTAIRVVSGKINPKDVDSGAKIWSKRLVVVV